MLGRLVGSTERVARACWRSLQSGGSPYPRSILIPQWPQTLATPARIEYLDAELAFLHLYLNHEMCFLPEISVVIPTFRRPNTLADTIRSALGDSGTDVEIIVVDDCPQQTAAPVVAEFTDQRIRYMSNPVPSCGRPAIVRNYGARFVTGSIIHFLDDDDLVPPGYYRSALEAFRVNSRIGVVFGRVEPFGPHACLSGEHAYFAYATRRARRCHRAATRWAFAAQMTFAPTLLVCGAAMIRRGHLATVGGFDETLPLVEDVDFYSRAIRLFPVRFLDQPALRYRIGASLMRQPNRDALLRQSYQQMHDAYRGRWGSTEFFAMKAIARVIGR